MTRSIRKVVVLGLCVVVALLVASNIQGQRSKKDKVKVTGMEIQERISKYSADAGVNHINDCVWMVVNFGDGTRQQFFHCPGYGSGTDKGTIRVVGDQVCGKWEKAFGGAERCYDIYRIDENKFEAWIDGKLESTGYILK